MKFNELSQNDYAKVKYVYKSEFMTDNKNDKTPDDNMKSESPLIYHVYNNNKIKVFRIIFKFLIKYIMYML